MRDAERVVRSEWFGPCPKLPLRREFAGAAKREAYFFTWAAAGRPGLFAGDGAAWGAEGLAGSDFMGLLVMKAVSLSWWFQIGIGRSALRIK